MGGESKYSARSLDDLSLSCKRVTENWPAELNSDVKDNLCHILKMAHTGHIDISSPESAKEITCLACAMILIYAEKHGPVQMPITPVVDLLVPNMCCSALGILAEREPILVSYCIKYFTTVVDQLACLPIVRPLLFRVFGIPSWFYDGEKFPQFVANLHPESRLTVEKIAAAYLTVDKKLAELQADSSKEESTSTSILLWHCARLTMRYGLLQIIKNSDVHEEQNLQQHLTVIERAFELLFSCLSHQTLRRVLMPLLDFVQLESHLQYSTTLARYCGFFVKRLTYLCRLDMEDHVKLKAEKLANLIRLQKFAFAEQSASPNPCWEVIATSSLYALQSDLRGILEAADLSFNTKIASQFLAEESIEELCKGEKKELINSILRYYSAETEGSDETSCTPTEISLWGDVLEEADDPEKEEEPLPLPRLRMQYVSLFDSVYTNAELYRLECFYAVRKDIERTIWQVQPYRSTTSQLAQTLFGDPEDTVVERLDPNIDYTNPHRNINWQSARHYSGLCIFGGSSPYSATVEASSIVSALDTVLGEITIDLKPITNNVAEWDRSVTPGALLYLVCLGGISHRYDGSIEKPEGCVVSKEFPYSFAHPADFAKAYNVLFFRTCRIVHASPPEQDSSTRKYTIEYDARQYRNDLVRIAKQQAPDNLYSLFNLAIRRKPETNMYASHLSTVDSILAEGKHIDQYLPSHFRESFVGYVESSKMPNVDLAVLNETLEKSRPGFPYTDNQKVAIGVALQPGLTCIIGPPGTGKTDVAVQIVSLLHDASDNAKTLLISRSNYALNQFFTKISQFGVKNRYLLRLGMGEGDLQIMDEGTGDRQDFTAEGRVLQLEQEKNEALSQIREVAEAFMLPTNLVEDCCSCLHFRDTYFEPTLAAYQRLCHSLGSLRGKDLTAVTESTDWNNMNSEQRFTHAMKSRLDKWRASHKTQTTLDRTSWSLFWPVENGELVFELDDDDEICRRKFEEERTRLGELFAVVKEYSPFESILTTHEKSQYMAINHAKIVAMTSSKALASRESFKHFYYSTIVIEEAGQLLELETVMTALLQNECKLTRIILLGDHMQLGPVVQNQILRDRCGLGRSLFERLIKLGYARICKLDKQGRMRSEMADIWRGHYDFKIGDMDHVPHIGDKSNLGFLYVCQCIDASQGREVSPVPHHFINHEEIEWCLALYAYMRRLSYKSQSIAILTAYSAQRDQLQRRFEELAQQYDWFEMPHKIATVDEYQGQQNDYVILSLVRTKRIGHLKDEGRMVVALSRARLGLYIVGNQKLLYSSQIGRKYLKPLWRATAESTPLYLLRRPTGESQDSTCEVITSPAELLLKVKSML